MSGGSFDYVYGKLENVLPEINRRVKSPLHKAFAKHLVDVCEALHDLEWYFSGDYGEEETFESIKKALGKGADKAQMEVIREELSTLVQEANKLIGGQKNEVESASAASALQRVEALKSPEAACNYARYVLKSRFPEAEPLIAQNVEWAYVYALEVVEGRWPEAEPVIALDAKWAYTYARHVIKGRFPEAEPLIAQDAGWAYHYARDVVEGRWPEGEPLIAREAGWAYSYANDVVEGRWPEGEPAIEADPCWSGKYLKNILKGRRPKARVNKDNG